MMPLPIAVCRCIWKRSMAAASSSRSCVGGCTSTALPANVTMPAFTSRGSSLTKSLAAACAACIRLGGTSIARMLSDTSMARMIVRESLGSVTTADGRATARIVTTIASRKRIGGTCRRQRCAGPIACLTSPRSA